MVAGINNIDMLIYIAVGIVSPFLVDVVVKKFASTKFKTLTLLAINLLTGFVVSFGTAFDAGLVFDWKAGLTAIAFSFVGGAASVFGFKNLNIIGADSPLATTGGIGSDDPAKLAAAGLCEAPRASVVAAVAPAGYQLAPGPVAPGAAVDPILEDLLKVVAKLSAQNKIGSGLTS